MGFQCSRDGGDEIRGQREFDALALKGTFVGIPVGDHRAHVRLHHGQHMRRGLLREEHVLGDLPADGCVLDQLIAGDAFRRMRCFGRGGGRAPARIDIGEHVSLGNAPVQSSARYTGQINALLGRHAGHDRRDKANLSRRGSGALRGARNCSHPCHSGLGPHRRA